MTKELYEARRKAYQDQLLVAQQYAANGQRQMLEGQQQMQQLQGAIADCDYWLGELAKSEPVKPNPATMEP